MWLTETNSVCDGGSNNLTNAYGNTPWLLNQLGAAGLRGVSMMGQQTLIGGDYGLLSGVGSRAQDPGWVANVTARPNFFANLLHRRLIGTKLLAVTLAPGTHARASRVGPPAAAPPPPQTNTTAVFAYCAANQTQPGAVAVVLINFGVEAARYELGLDGPLEVYGLLGTGSALPEPPTPEDILALVTSPSVYLNGVGPLSVGSGLSPRVLPAGTAVGVPALGVAIVVAPQARAPACAAESSAK
jgi:hypothetical protein